MRSPCLSGGIREPPFLCSERIAVAIQCAYLEVDIFRKDERDTKLPTPNMNVSMWIQGMKRPATQSNFFPHSKRMRHLHATSHETHDSSSWRFDLDWVRNTIWFFGNICTAKSCVVSLTTMSSMNGSTSPVQRSHPQTKTCRDFSIDHWQNVPMYSPLGLDIPL